MSCHQSGTSGNPCHIFHAPATTPILIQHPILTADENTTAIPETLSLPPELAPPDNLPQDARDALKSRKRLISHDLTVSFARPAGEPMLWLPDAVAGAMSASVLGEDRWLTALAEVITVHQFVVR